MSRYIQILTNFRHPFRTSGVVEIQSLVSFEHFVNFLQATYNHIYIKKN
jgi:hypothetical protein